jgi:hypothetical protein
VSGHAGAIIALLGAALAAAPASADPGATTAAGPPATASRDFAADQLDRMARFLAGLPGFEVELLSSHDAVQPDGQKIEFGELRAVALARPDRLRVEQQRSDGARDLVVFDGRDISVFDGEEGVYAQVPQPGTLDDAILYFVRDLGMRLPLAPLLGSRLGTELDAGALQVDYVEFTELLDQPAHHIAGRGADVDFQVWIAAGEQPLPLRIVLTYRNEPGQPQFRAQFLDWRPGIPAEAGLFRFDPPAAARRIAFAAQVPTTAVPAAATGREQE